MDLSDVGVFFALAVPCFLEIIPLCFLAMELVISTRFFIILCNFSFPWFLLSVLPYSVLRVRILISLLKPKLYCYGIYFLITTHSRIQWLYLFSLHWNHLTVSFFSFFPPSQIGSCLKPFLFLSRFLLLSIKVFY